MPPTRQTIRTAALPDLDADVRRAKWAPAETGRLPLEDLFASATEAVLIAETNTTRVVEANAAAVVLFRAQRDAVVGGLLAQLFDAADAARIQSAVQQARSAGSATVIEAKARGGSAPLRITFSKVVLAPDQSVLLTRLMSPLSAASMQPLRSPAFEALEAAAFGFVVTDVELRIQYANAAFAALIAVKSALLVDRPLPHWLRLSAQHRELLQQQMGERRAVSEISTTLRCGPTAVRRVEVCALAVPAASTDPCWAFTIRLAQTFSALN